MRVAMRFFRSNVLGLIALSVVLSGAATAAVTSRYLAAGQKNLVARRTAIQNTGNGPALVLRVKPGQPPLKVNSSKLVPNLNAQKLGGRLARAFALRNATYTKTQSEARFLSANESYTRAELDARYARGGDVYTKAQSDSRYALTSGVYTKSQSDGRYAQTSAVYTKSESDSKYASTSSVYTKTETDTKYAPADDVYTKTEVDDRIDEEIAAGPGVLLVAPANLTGTGAQTLLDDDVTLPADGTVVVLLNGFCGTGTITLTHGLTVTAGASTATRTQVSLGAGCSIATSTTGTSGESIAVAAAWNPTLNSTFDGTVTVLFQPDAN